MALPCPLSAVFMMHFVYKGHAYQLCGFAMTSTAIYMKGKNLKLV